MQFPFMGSDTLEALPMESVRMEVFDALPLLEPEPQIEPRLQEVLRRVWGFDRLRPLQAEAMAAALAGRDSLVVLPTGGGKSLCFQAPAVVAGGLTLVVSPLI